MPKYLILGPEDQDQLPQFWNRDWWQWVDRDSASLYTEREVFCFPPRELPVGGRGILDIETGLLYTPHCGGGDYKTFRNNS